MNKVADKTDRWVLGMLHNLTQVVLVHQDITVAYEHVAVTGFSIGRYQIVHFRIKTDIVLLHDKGDIPLRVFVLHLFRYFVGWIVEVLEAKEDFVFRVILEAEA